MHQQYHQDLIFCFINNTILWAKTSMHQSSNDFIKVGFQTIVSNSRREGERERKKHGERERKKHGSLERMEFASEKPQLWIAKINLKKLIISMELFMLRSRQRT